MARVHLETRAMAESRFAHLGEALNMKRYETLGFLGLFWHDTQERLIVYGTKERLERFIPAVDGFTKEQLFKALLQNEYLKKAGSAHFEIAGNKKQVEWLKSCQEAGKRGGGGRSNKNATSKKPPAQLVEIKENRKSKSGGVPPSPLSKILPGEDVAEIKEKSTQAILYNTIQYNIGSVDAEPAPAVPAAVAAPPPAQLKLPDWDRPTAPAIPPSRPAPRPPTVPAPKEPRYPVDHGPRPPDIGALWNAHCGPLPKVVTLSTMRKKLWSARWRKNPDEKYWIGLIERVAASKFCRGETDRGKWVANLDWFLKEPTHVKILEGQYDDRSGGGQQRRQYTFQEGG